MDLANVLITPSAPIHDAVARIDRARSGALAVVDGDGRLLGVITDGDIRRALLARVDFAQPVQTLLDRRPRELYPEPVTASIETTRPERLALMRARKVRHLPILDSARRVVEFDQAEEIWDAALDVRAVIMAGGFGRRMRPLTDLIPKPLLPVGTKPVLEHLIEHLASAGVRDITIATHYRGDQIKTYCGDGASWNVAIRYVSEDTPLGTGGALKLVGASDTPLFVVNGDILTKLDVPAMVRFHREHRADMTIGIRTLETQVPYGVVEVEGETVVGVLEKPIAHYFVNAGAYLVEPSVIELVPGGSAPLDMPDLVSLLIARGRRVVGFPVREYWLDIGHPEQYARAQADHADGRF
ncbi:MAG: nucleotidyltransferase family protein [Acidobacteriota bacterium]|nr:nucleotidyltransferase family protein [Acidobacteriota bacterium]